MSAINVHVPCAAHYADDGEPCGQGPIEHVHQPTPCQNGKDVRHHDYQPPKSVTLLIAGQRKRVRLVR